MPNVTPENRCQWIGISGQCPQSRMDDEPFCEQHVANRKDKQRRAYHIENQLVAPGVDRHNAVEQIKSLREEIALARALIETRINMAESNTDLLVAMPVINSYLATIEKLVNSCHTMETKLGTLLSKGSIISLAQKMIQIIDAALTDVPNKSMIIDGIAEEFTKVIKEQDNG